MSKYHGNGTSYSVEGGVVLDDGHPVEDNGQLMLQLGERTIGQTFANLEDWRSFNDILDIPLTMTAREHANLDINAKAGISPVTVARLCMEMGATPGGRRGNFYCKEVASWDKGARLGDLVGMDMVAIAQEEGAKVLDESRVFDSTHPNG
tara:strand:- start:289 stop:738 length:450 start_codon:yes stop_codon:yes gene_type:complete